MKEKNTKGFTLIELLAVIVILGIIMLIAVPSISSVITNSRKDAYVRTAEEYIEAASKAIVSGEIAVDIGKSKTVKLHDLALENGLSKSPFGAIFLDHESYVKITNSSTSEKTVYRYAIALGDANGNCIPLTDRDDLKRTSVTTDCQNAIYIDPSGANEPELIEGMIPVVYSEDKKNWVKADITTAWYDYSNQLWANAVTVTEENRSTYLSAGSGTVIPMNDINTMWVWIPRYEYQYSNLGDQYASGTQEEPGEIKINFISQQQVIASDETIYKVPSGFTFGTQELSGIWYGKFETSPHRSCNPTYFSFDSECNSTDLLPVIKPNTNSWNGITVSTAFQVSRMMQTTHYSTYGFAHQGSYDVHMSRNSEWAIISYLSQSKYGKYGNSRYVGKDKEIFRNDVYLDSVKTTMTGCTSGFTTGSFTETCVYPYDNVTYGGGASTTGNITGIYDTNGGLGEYVMGVMKDDNGQPRSGGEQEQNSGFSGMVGDGSQYIGFSFPEAKYYDLYGSPWNASKACNGGICYGDALSEVAGYYQDNSTFINNGNTWLVRSGAAAYGSEKSGVFYFGCANGSPIDTTFRIVITP